MSRIQDYADGGFLPLQDFQTDPRISISRRKMIAGCRVTKEHDPTLESSPSGHHTEIGRDGGLGTIGDVHPWLFWQTSSRGARGMGAWQSVFAAVTDAEPAAGGGPSTGGSTGPSYVFPVRRDGWRSDRRFAPKPATYGPGMQLVPRGVMSIVLPATEERAQYELVGKLDPRLFAPNAGGPGDVGTIVADLQPDWEPCMGASNRPGIGGRQAKLQSLVRVIAMPPGGGTTDNLFPSAHNLLALNFTASDQDGVPGYGAVFGKCVMSGGGMGPITQGGSTQGGAAAALGSSLAGGDTGKTPAEWGTFRPLQQPQYAVALLDAFDAGGVIHCGHVGDKHRIGTDRDGHAINSAHLSVNANWFRNQDRDGPMLFEGLYPNPGPLPLMGRVHLTWDGDYTHYWRGRAKSGVWRWWCEVPYLVPPPTTGQPPTPGQPPGTPTPRPRGPTTPGGPATPGAPGAPVPPAPPTGGPPGPGTGGPAGPAAPGGGAPPAPPGPITPNPGGTRFPGYPATPPAPRPAGGGPITPGGGPGGGSGDAPDPNDQPGPMPPTRDEPVLPSGSNLRPGRTVGGDETKHRKDKKPNILFPFSTGQAGTSQRPQKWQAGAQDFLYSDLGSVSAQDVMADEASRPHVLASTPWGSQTNDCWNYVETPAASTLRGGTASGGLLHHPPGQTMEGYFGLAATFSAWAPTTTSYVAHAPGVWIALGQPHRDGGLAGDSIRIRQQSAAAPQMYVDGLDAARTAYPIAQMGKDPATGDVVSQFFGNAIRLPVGASSARPSAPTGGHLRTIDDSIAATPEVYEPYSNKWLPLVVAEITGYCQSGLAVLGRGDGTANSSYQELQTSSGSNEVLRESGGVVGFGKLAYANCTFGVQASEAGNPVREVCKSSITEATLTSLTLPANLLTAAGSHAVLEWWGDALNNSGSTSAMTLRIKVAGTTIYQQAASVTTSANRRALHGRIVLAWRASNAQRMSGVVTFSQATAAAVGVGDWADSSTARGGPIYGDATATASSSMAIAVTFQSDVNSASIGVRLYGATLTFQPG